ncbi:GNAT family N-acetyltransferase [Candidatus Woesebacteria bacterium]|nr:GNAT family N-acetyltransferase [Candidatus Woesebacteria bacterium]
MVTIRPYTTADYDQLVLLLQEAELFASTWESKENLESMIKDNPNAVLVGVDGDTIVASVFSLPYGKKITFFYRLAVKKSHRNQGIATAMLEHAEKAAKAQGVIETCLFADTHNEMLQAFYRKRGFVTSEHTYTCFWKEYSNK